VEAAVREIRRTSRKNNSAEEQVRILLEGLQGEVTIAGLCCKEGIHPNMYYKWSAEFLEAASQEVNEMHNENEQIKALVAALSLKSRMQKKACCARKRSGMNDTYTFV
jgi:transposase